MLTHHPVALFLSRKFDPDLVFDPCNPRPVYDPADQWITPNGRVWAWGDLPSETQRLIASGKAEGWERFSLDFS